MDDKSYFNVLCDFFLGWSHDRFLPYFGSLRTPGLGLLLQADVLAARLREIPTALTLLKDWFAADRLGSEPTPIPLPPSLISSADDR